MDLRAKRTKNAVIFIQDKLSLRDAMALEKQSSIITFFGHHTKMERIVSGFKFGFVITKIK